MEATHERVTQLTATEAGEPGEDSPRTVLARTEALVFMRRIEVNGRYCVRVPLRYVGTSTTEALTCRLARADLRQSPGDSHAFTPLILATLGPL